MENYKLIVSRKIKGTFVSFITLSCILTGWYNVK